MLRRSTVRLGILLVIVIAAAGQFTEAGERTILRIYAWSDYFDHEVLAEFEDLRNCVVAIDTFDANEAMLDTLLAGTVHPYDIVTPSAYMSVEMYRQGLLSAIDHSLIPNLGNLDRAFAGFTGDPLMEYSVPYTRTVTGVGYNTAKLPGIVRSWAVFGNREQYRRTTMLADVRESMGAALKYLGYSLNTSDDAELADAAAQLRRWRDNIAKFEVDEGNIGLGSGQYLAVQGYNGDVAMLMEENSDIGFFVPEEGSAISIDDFVVPANSANPGLAHAFINHMLDTKVAAKNMASILYYMPVTGALELVPEKLLSNQAFSVPAATLAKCEVIRDLGDDTAKYEELWEAIINAH